MNKITFPLRMRMKSDAVADLHAALVKLGHDVSQGDRRARRFGASTRDAVKVFQKTHELPITGEVDEATANKLNELIKADPPDEPRAHRVTGRVVRADGEPVKGAELRFFRQGITKREPLGRRSSAKTDAGGRFELEYRRPDEPLDLGIELVADAERDIAETRSRLIGNPAPEEHVRFVVGDKPLRGRSSFERLEKAIERALAAEDVEPSAITDFDEGTLARLSLRSGKTPRELVLLRQAYAVAKDTGIDPAVVYGMGKAGKVSIASKAALLVQDPAKRRGAIKAALAANEIPARLEGEAARALETLDEMTVAEALVNPAARDVTSVGTLLEAAGLSEDKRSKLAARYRNHAGAPEELWKTAVESGELTAAEVEAVQLELQLAVATQNHAPLNRALKERGVARVEDLAKLDKPAWLGLIQGVGRPADLKAAGTSEKEYAELIFRVVEDALPTAMVANRVASFPDASRIKAFLDHNPDYDLRATPVRTYLAANPGALSFSRDDGEASAIAAAMKRVERAYRLAPPGERVATMETLLADGLDSAQKIRSLGRAAFVRRYETKLGSRAAAERVFRRANNASALSAIVAARYAPAFNATPLFVLPNPELPTMADFFGSQDFCSCEHCQSVFSPAAYLVDVLHWLDGRPSTVPGKQALDILFEDRRADIGTIELSCTSTHTPLPTIDLVNEMLELLVAPPTAPVSYQTTGTAADLRAHPENLRREAYTVLAGAEASTTDAVYPFDLPFNLWLQEARVYLGQLGVKRHRLMEALQGAAAARADVGAAVEILGMSPAEWDVIAGRPKPQRQPEAFWGLDASFVTTLANLSRFLEQAGMAFSELADLLRTDVVQGQASLSVKFTGSNCDTEEATLVGLAQPHLDRLHRFIRLRRRLGWSAADLDRAVINLGSGALDEACLKKIAQVQRLAEEVKRPVSELLTWWGSLDTRRWSLRLVEQLDPTGFELSFSNQLLPRPERNEDASPYDRLFLDPSLQVDPSTAFDINASGDELQTPVSQGLNSQLTPIAAALGSTAEELGDLLPLLGAQPADLDLANLSALHRHLSLARALSLSARELVSALALTGIDPFTSPGEALAFIDEVRFMRSSGFSIEELDYLLRHVDTKPATLEPDDTEIGILFFELGAALRAAEAQHPPPALAASDGELRQGLAQTLGLLLQPVAVNEAMAFIDVELAANQPPPAGGEQLVDDSLAHAIDPTEAKNKLAIAGPQLLRTRRERLEYALIALTAHLREAAKASEAVQRLSSAAGFEPSVCAPLLRHLSDPAGSGLSLLELFRDDAVRDHDEPLPSPSDLPVQFGAYKLLRKAALLLARLRIDRTELGWVLEQGPTRGTLDLQSLPVTAGPSTIPYPGWRRLREAISLRDTLSPRVVLDLFETAAGSQPDHEALLTELERRSHWDRADIEFLVGTPARPNAPAVGGALGFQYPDDWKDERPLARLAEVMKVVRRIGLSAATIWGWREISTSGTGTPAELQTAIDDHEKQATEIKQAVRARHDGARWYEVAPELRDRLRERQRDALVSWLLGNPRGPGLDPFADAAAVFEHLLLDVEISPCQLTSRIKQAISSTQLFVQRILLGLEPLVEFSRADAEEWGWRKSYRVWEANRKVFLYPENYLEPELRDNKSPFFLELEDELLQSEVTAESAERAVRRYLEKLDEVARLEVVGLCEQEDDGASVLHVFGRTRGVPPAYYYRQRINGVRWTPWEKVEAAIEGDHLIPVVFNRRLYIFWATINEAAIEEDPVHIPALPDRPQVGRPQRYYEIHLAWSQRRDGQWSAKKVASDYIGRDLSRLRTPGGLRADVRREDFSTPADFFFRPLIVNAPAGSPSGQDLVIEPIRYRPPKPVAGAMLARRRNDGPGRGPGGIDDCGFELPPPEPPDDPPDDPEPDESGYYRLPRFRMSGCDDTVTLEPRAGERRSMSLPPETITVNQTFARFPALSASDELAFPAPNVATPGFSPEQALTGARPPFQIVPERMDDFRSQRPFFFQDQRRTFFIEPRGFYPWIREAPEWAVAAKMVLEPSRLQPGLGDRPALPGPDPWEYDPAAAISPPPAVTVGRLAHVSPTDGLAARAGTAVVSSLGPRVAFVSSAPVDAEPTRMVVGMGARVVNTNGEVLGDLCPGGPPVMARELPWTVVNTTYVMPDLAETEIVTAPLLTWWAKTTYRFDAFYHPYACLMRRELNRFGLDGLFAPSASGLVRQELEDSFFSAYGPTSAVRQPRPIDSFDFSPGGAYSIYNWEIFFHVPFRVACQLSQNQRFAEAQRWFHYIFDPTETEGEAPRRFWKVKPLAALLHGENEDTGPIAELLLLLQYEGSDPAKLRARDELLAEVAAMRAHPFSPHALARLRLAVYARAVVMKYIDNLIDWADHLFRRDTMESINEATQLYVLAAQLLGRRPREVERDTRPAKSFADLRQAGLDAFGNALLEEIEGMLPETTETGDDVYEDDIDLIGGTLFFCVPPNEKLLTDYWGRVADRLFKIRHCMNIEGVVRQLPLFEPPIDPALLVRARSAGIDLATALTDLSAPLPCYRYRVLVRKATEICADVRGLGQALLSALEKKDAEELTLLRAGHQVKLERALLDVRETQVDEAKEALAALARSKESAEIRRDYYRSRPYMNPAESAQLGLSATAGLLDSMAGGIRAVGAILGGAPDAEAGGAGFGGSPVVTFTFGGTQVSLSTTAAAASLQINAGIADRLAQLSGHIGTYERRADDWQHQGDLADKDIEALKRQIVAAELRVAIAEKELANLELQLEQSREAESFISDKYTNVQLYQWMVRQLSSLHFQAYQLAYELAKRAERAWQFELGLPDKTFIQFGYWDSLKKGLLAGDRLQHDLQRMDAAYLEANRREYELVRHVSLRELDPEALLRLKRDARCHVEVPEEWFDLATPGHYMRRIKTVALSLPSVTGPYVSVPCTLTLESGSIRTSPDSGNATFRDDLVDIQSIVTSQAQEDHGLFETSLGDERYLPFEGAGAISRWRLDLPAKFRPFDYETISDAILHIRYTAREGGKALRDDAETRLASAAGARAHLVSARSDFPDAWARFLAPPQTQTDQALTLPIDPRLFPFAWRESPIRINGLELFLVIENIAAYRTGADLELDVKPPAASSSTASLSSSPGEFGGLPRDQIAFTNDPQSLGDWTITFTESSNTGAASSVVSTTDGHRRLNPEDVRDLLIVFRYEIR